MSSCVDSGFDAHRTTSAPPACSVSARFAVSEVMCRQPAILTPRKVCSRAKRSRIELSTGISRPAHSALRAPSGASDRSLMSYSNIRSPSVKVCHVFGGTAG